MNLFIKKLGSNESGYSGDKPDQRGKFILIPNNALSTFPPLSNSTLNDNTIMRFRLLSGEEIATNIVYHNAKFFPDHFRKHNEVRLYRNSALDNALKLDRDVIVVILQLDLHLYSIASIQPDDKNYSIFENYHCKNLHDLENLKNIQLIQDLQRLKNCSSGSIANEREVIEFASKSYKQARAQQPAAEGDPGVIFSALINNQDKFKDFVRQAYDNKCALRGTSLVRNNAIGCEAAHIQPASHNGPLLPTNGILLSADLHKCFDGGLITLSDQGRVIVSKKIPKESEIHSFDGKLITPSAGWEIYRPYSKYCDYNRTNVFESRFVN